MRTKASKSTAATPQLRYCPKDGVRRLPQYKRVKVTGRKTVAPDQQPLQQLHQGSEHLQFEELIADLSARFVNVPANQVDQEIREAQRRVCEYLGFEQSGLWELDPLTENLMLLRLFYRSVAGPPIPERVEADMFFPWCLREVLANRIVNLPSVAQAPPEAAVDLATWRRFGIKSNLTFPLSVGGGPVFGVISFSTLRAERTWTEPTVKRLVFVAQVFANALARKRSEQALQESVARLRLTAEAAGIGLWSLDEQTKVFWLTPKTRELFGFDPDGTVTWEMFQGVVHPDDRVMTEQALQRAIANSDAVGVEYRIVRPDGAVRWIKSRGRVYPNPVGGAGMLMGVSMDITADREAERERQRNRAEVAHLTRVTMLGELSGSIAHELNQPLTAILSNAQAAQRFLATDTVDLAELREIIGDIIADDRRAGEIIRHLRLLLQKGEIQLQQLDLNQVVADILKLVHNDLLNHGITLETVFAPDLPPVWGDWVQLQQVMLNLIVNACDAMAACAPQRRRLVVRTERAAGRARVLFVDSGPGLSREVMARLFDPFFTTKPTGLGLGLKVCRTILAAHGSRLEVANNPDQGATFSFSLPAAQEMKDEGAVNSDQWSVISGQ